MIECDTNATGSAARTALVDLETLSELVGIPKGQLWRRVTYGFRVGGEAKYLRATWKGRAILSSRQWVAEFDAEVLAAREAVMEARRARNEERAAAKRTGRPPGRPRKVDPNEQQAAVAAAEARLKAMGC